MGRAMKSTDYATPATFTLLDVREVALAEATYARKGKPRHRAAAHSPRVVGDRSARRGIQFCHLSLIPGMSRSTVSLSQFVLKALSRCDLACHHCYVYEAADQGWRGRLMTISDEMITRTAQRIAEHASSHRLGTAQVIPHGGEALVAGRARLRRVATELRSALHAICRLEVRIQTDGVLLDKEFCALFAEHNVNVGISVDGDQQANGRHRRYADDRSSYNKVLAAIRLLRTVRFRRLYGGLPCTIDIANVFYECLLRVKPPRLDWELPTLQGTPIDSALQRVLPESSVSAVRIAAFSSAI
jgi:uncharacterized Fe-S cluster-containing radical SAM superfamily protein